MGPYIVTEVTKSGLATLKNYNKIQLKPAVNPPNSSPVAKHADSVDDEKPANIGERDDQKPDEKRPENTCIWAYLPDEIVEKILLECVSSSPRICETYSNIVYTCSRFQIINETPRKFLPRLHIDPEDVITKSFIGKAKVSVRKSLKVFGKNSGLLLEVSRVINDDKWKSAWLVLVENERPSMYTIEKIFWKTAVIQSRYNEENDVPD